METVYNVQGKGESGKKKTNDILVVLTISMIYTYDF